MARERILFDGWELTEGTVRDWEYRSGMDSVAAMVGDNLTVANRSGEVWAPKELGPGRFQVALWLGGDTVTEAQDAWRVLLRAVFRLHRQIKVERTLASGEVIWCDAEVAGGIEPTHLGQNGYRAAITFNVPSGVWQSSTIYTDESPAGIALPHTLNLTKFEPSTAPLELLTYRVYGPVTNPKLIDNTDGGYTDTLLYADTIPSGGYVDFDAAAWRVTGGGGYVASQAKANPTGRRLMAVTAARPNDKPSVRLEGTGAGSATKLRVTGKRAYLC